MTCKCMTVSNVDAHCHSKYRDMIAIATKYTRTKDKVQSTKDKGQRARPVYKRMGVPLTTVALPLKTPLLS